MELVLHLNNMLLQYTGIGAAPEYSVIIIYWNWRWNWRCTLILFYYNILELALELALYLSIIFYNKLELALYLNIKHALVRGEDGLFRVDHPLGSPEHGEGAPRRCGVDLAFDGAHHELCGLNNQSCSYYQIKPNRLHTHCMVLTT